MPDRVAIDPLEETVRIGGGVWRFDWDASTGRLSIELGGRTYELHGITWRQKVNLARAVSAGTLPIARGVLRASLGRGGAVPADDQQREVLTALAEWLTASSDPLPWDPATLARVTMGVCRESGFAPRDLDELPAADIEDMWKGIDATATAPRVERVDAPAVEPVAAPPPAARPPAINPAPAFRGTEGFNRIIIVPEPAAPTPAEAVDAPGRSVAPSPFNLRGDTVGAPGPAGFAAAPPDFQPEHPSAEKTPLVAHPGIGRPESTTEPSVPHLRRLRVPSAAVQASAPFLRASAPSVRAAAPVARQAVPVRADQQTSAAESGSPRTLVPARYRMESSASAPRRPSPASPTGPAVSPQPAPRSVDADRLPSPPPLLPVEALDTSRLLPASSGIAMPVVAVEPAAVPQRRSPPLDERDLIPFLTTRDDTRAAAPWSAGVARRFEDDLTRAAIEAGVDLEP